MEKHIKVETVIDLDEIWNSIHDIDDKERFIKKHIHVISNNDIIDIIGGIDAIIDYLNVKDYTTTDKVKLRKFIANINEIQQETII